jgi:hypothetical protein
MFRDMSKTTLGIERFPEIITSGRPYVDKTKYISTFANGGYYYLSRPRYFGKSLFLDTLKVALEGKKEFFKGLYLEQNWDWDKEFLVIKISFGNFYVRSAQELEGAIVETIEELETFYQLEPQPRVTLATRFYRLIKGLYEKSGGKVVVLVDDCAKPLHDTHGDITTVIECQKVLKGFYTVLKRSAPYVHLAFFCGIGNFYKSSLFIGLSEMTDISLVADFSTMCGFTQEEVDFLLEKLDQPVDSDQLKKLYYGYSWGGERCYNPFDVLSAIKEKRCHPYWAEAVRSKEVIRQFNKSKCYLPTLEGLSVSETSLLHSDMGNIDFVSYLFQMGYLTIASLEEYNSFRRYTLTYTNESIRGALVMRILRELVQTNSATAENIAALHKALIKTDIEGFKDIFDSFFHSIHKSHLENQTGMRNNGFHAAVFYSYFAVTGFEFFLEESNCKNYICISIKVNDTIYYLDFLIGQDVRKKRSVLDLVREQGYAGKYYGPETQAYIIACNFSRKNNRVVRFDWEKVKTPEGYKPELITAEGVE